MRNKETVGTALAAGGAFSYGVTVIFGRRLASDGLSAATALGFRFAAAAIVLAVLLRLRGVRVIPERTELVRVVLLGAIGYTAQSTFFYMSLQRGTAAAAALLFYVYPAIVCLIEMLRGRERPAPSTLIALALAIAGTSVVVTTGARVSITTAGIVFVLLAAALFAAYLLASREIVKGADAMRAAAWVAAGASSSNFLRGAIQEELRSPYGHIWQLLLYGLFTASAFALTFAALERIGASRTAVVMTLEAVTAVLLGAIVLGERIHTPQLVGGAAILLAAATISRRRAEDAAPAELRE
jgi:drug/metabolite transporter (DMT)-like permease